MSIDARDKFERIERFDHIIVRAEIEPQNLVAVKLRRRQNDDGDIAIVSYILRQFVAVHSGHHYIDDRKVDFLFVENLARFHAVLCPFDVKPFVFKIKFQEFYNIFIVFCNQYVEIHRPPHI